MNCVKLTFYATGGDKMVSSEYLKEYIRKKLALVTDEVITIQFVHWSKEGYYVNFEVRGFYIPFKV